MRNRACNCAVFPIRPNCSADLRVNITFGTSLVVEVISDRRSWLRGEAFLSRWEGVGTQAIETTPVTKDPC